METNSLKVFSPFDLSLVGELELMTSADADEALSKAQALFLDRAKWIPKHQRIKILYKIANLLEYYKEELINIAIKEGAKPLKDTRVEMERAIDGVHVAIRTLQQRAGREIPMGINDASVNRFAVTTYEPKGVVLAISAFNHPINLIIHQIIPAIATGCPCLIKPALKTPLSCKKIVDIIHEAGLPHDWVQFLLVENSRTEQIAQDSRISYLNFIGSSKVGWSLRSKLAAGTSCTLEHGGAAPVIIEADADIKSAIPLLVKGAFYHAGQVCVSVQRIFVQKSIRGSFQEEFIKQVSKLKTGDPMEESTDVGPLIEASELDRIEAWVNEAANSGAQILCGGKRISETCFQPTVILNPHYGLAVSKLEIFGPVVCIYDYEDTEEAIAAANSIPFAFQAAVFSQNIDKCYEMANKINAQSVMINDQTAFRVDWMPFGAYKESGLGLGGIENTMKDMSIEKLIVLKSKAF